VNAMSSNRSAYLMAAALCALSAVIFWRVLAVRGDLRLLAVIIGAVGLVFLCMTRPRLTLLLTIAWLPFLGFMRRLMDPGGEPGADPMLLVVPVVTLVLTALAAWNRREHLVTSVDRSRTTLLVSLLLLALIMSVFNPIQGNPVVGLSGTIFLFFPALWFYLGRMYFDDDTVMIILQIMVWTGLVCALYGFYQAVAGFSAAEQHWIATRNFASLQVGRFIRPVSTFPSPEEWSRYMMVAAISAFGIAMAGSARRLLMILIGAVCVGAVFLSAIRISAFGLLVCLAVLVVAMAKSRVRAIGAIAVLGLVALLFTWIAPAISINEEYASNVALDAFFGRASRGIVDPLSEGTLWERIRLWGDLFGRIIPEYPLGMGLSVPTLGAWKFDSAVKVGTESYAVAVFVATGFIGGGLLLAVFWGVMGRTLRLYRGHPKPVIGIVTALTAGIIFTSLIGNSLSLYTVGPLGWGLMGWLSTRNLSA
jgi:hypothetical protein